MSDASCPPEFDETPEEYARTLREQVECLENEGGFVPREDDKSDIATREQAHP